MSQQAIPATLMRGGTSRGLYISATDLPDEPGHRDALLLAAMGSPDARQIDGVGGAHPLTSKVAVLARPTRPEADIDYLFLQVSVDTATVSDAQNCGNLLAGVGPWAIENGWVETVSDTTDVIVHMVNTGSLAVVTVTTPDGSVRYDGEARIDGVPGTAAPISIVFLDVAGASCGALLPTGNVRDVVDGVEVSCIDNGMPVVIVNSSDFDVTGVESPAMLDADDALKRKIEALRLAIGPRMNLGDVTHKTVPKMCLIAAPAHGGAITTRTFIPHRVHDAIGVLGAVSVATACAMPGSLAHELAQVAVHEREEGPAVSSIDVEHPTGSFSVSLRTDADGQVTQVALLRTARKLFSGSVYVPRNLQEGLPA